VNGGAEQLCQVFELVARGKRNKQIGHELGIAEDTVKLYRNRVMAKAQVQSFVELVSVAERMGVLASRLPLTGDGGSQTTRATGRRSQHVGERLQRTTAAINNSRLNSAARGCLQFSFLGA
jgi:DNA-binding CsgD family transcriptional regulator